jgi:6-phosphogluconate dehydrogenase
MPDIENYKECQEAMQYAEAAKEAEAKAGNCYPLHDYWGDVAKRKWTGADTALKAHRLGQCACQIRAAIAARG